MKVNIDIDKRQTLKARLKSEMAVIKNDKIGYNPAYYRALLAMDRAI